MKIAVGTGFTAASALLSALLVSLTASLAVAERPLHELRIYKAERRMELWVDGRAARSFRVALGGSPEGDKRRQGDNRTPEGIFFIAWKNPRSQFHRFLGLSYPMARHADRALADGLIKKTTHARVTSAEARRVKPPQDTALGGWVGVHGGGSGYDWTLGCIAVSDAEIEWLFERLRVGDRVSVFPNAPEGEPSIASETAGAP